MIVIWDDTSETPYRNAMRHCGVRHRESAFTGTGTVWKEVYEFLDHS